MAVSQSSPVIDNTILLDLDGLLSYLMSNPGYRRWMANAIGARKGLFHLQQLLAKYPVALAVVFPLENLHNLLRKRSKLSLQDSMFKEDFISARVSNQICQLEPRNVVCFGFHFQLIARQYFLELVWFKVVSALVPETMK